MSEAKEGEYIPGKRRENKRLPADRAAKVKQSTMIYQSNALIDSVYRLSTAGKRCFAMALGIVGNKDVKPNGSARDEFPFIAEITVADYAAIFDLPLENASRDMLEGVVELSRTTATFYKDGRLGRVKGNFTIIPFAYEIKAENAKNGQGHYRIELHPQLMAHIGALAVNFTQYDLLNVGRLTTNQWRLYEKLAKHKKHYAKPNHTYGTWFTSYEFCAGDYFDIGDSIKKYPNEMKRRFLDSAIEGVNEHTDLFTVFEDNSKQWVFKIYSGDAANKMRVKWQRDRQAAKDAAKKLAAEKRKAKRLAAKAAEEAEG